MAAETNDMARVLEALEGLRGEVARLAERVSALESAPASTRAEGVPEELALVIAAAVAAYLGKRAHVRQIRLLGSAAWAQQGRVTVQASHRLDVHHS